MALDDAIQQARQQADQQADQEQRQREVAERERVRRRSLLHEAGRRLRELDACDKLVRVEPVKWWKFGGDGFQAGDRFYRSVSDQRCWVLVNSSVDLGNNRSGSSPLLLTEDGAIGQFRPSPVEITRLTPRPPAERGRREHVSLHPLDTANQEIPRLIREGRRGSYSDALESLLAEIIVYYERVGR